ncbi:hypothetical protein ACWY7Q_004350 [Enterobacter hormaechei]|uniref:hypothetical protein n=1 Tax=Enterobacter hormaechei TaxID=158836 RepID=UPI00125257B7|nr:hypothetical protein [Enterobacter hormaechei]MCH1621596.1 hypothetical protein [Enterobacter hormaechei]MCH1632383.1 hypothetical protein [Enterobacter hormaechei]MDS6617976.1 hypothetical protein [Enterobacter hormaechei]MDS6636431.1 hypothetical protein [Enterobacter hormaechei]MDS6639302.1 hypothetical protein [Enterobacter hormaechei]
MKQKFIEWFTNNNNGCSPAMEDDRSFVREKTQHMFEAYQAGVAEGEARCAALAAENAGLKESRKNLAEFIHDELNADYPLNMDIETPATDAFLAEVRAQVWIEGNQPAEFGRYWVRYETDVGPRYCSAQWMEHNFCAGSDTNIHRIWLADHSRSINSLRGVTHYTQLPTALESSQLRKGVQS